MYFARIALFALPAIAAAIVLPRGDTCQTGTSQYCCQNVQNANTLSQSQKELASLAGFNMDNAGAQFGTSCTPITNSVGGGLPGLGSKSSAGCSTQNVCCQGATSNGLIAQNCSPVST
ncbi:hypothetical protein M378DRAFT_179833 [Amanita muscaria Koide BX008]|uniref:Hydrophobin n=1 Tax=Amanita muscaria (strain Koide BX008) TaxID=946122 RepID=A0A0C2WZ46_AMAMK|nr:hypothetical protein M378DRAFT_179833 [Amanita muscaria Koide BX008]